MADKRLLVAYMGGFIGPLAGNTILALLAPLGETFQVGDPEILLSIPVYMVPFVIFQLFSGTVSDLIGRKVLAASGFLIYSVGSFFCGWAGTLPIFLGGRFIQGLGFAFVTPVLHAIVGDYTRHDSRGVSMGIFGAATAAAVSSGPLIAGFLGKVDWRLTFYLIAGLAVLVSVAIQLAFRGKEPATAVHPRAMKTSVREIATKPSVITVCAAGFLTFFGFIGVISYTSAALKDPPFSYDTLTVGAILFSGGIGGVFISPLAGLLVDTIGRFRTAMYGYVITSFGLLILLFCNDVWQFAGGMVVVGCASSMIWASLLTLTVEIVPERRGAVSSLFNSSRFGGYAISPAIFGMFYDYTGFRSIFLVAVALSFLGIAVVLLLKRLLTQNGS